MLDIIPALLLVTGTVFLVLLIVLNKTLYKPLLEFIDNRNNSINRDLENAGKNASDVVAYYQEIETILSEAKFEAAKIREAAINEANEKALKRIEQKKNELEVQTGVFFTTLESEKNEFKNSLMAQMPLFKESVHAKLNTI
ncbi:FoF1 ATP synthase subunit B' [Sulfurospirillum deleyianum]|uniref:H+transporting two-sector ATPase B/B' subunit n=1 Tax=Sulfurospirillum deleyianum (strain ATCC 51133 / DSM 6946 / 5175) TaxID=525898 RepID=D1AZT0_SULD5|nr:FoF1 ATP synthase subunit B' [Sulfurospirillum deleyianum]ACZ11547.1 H+transporting two-sector ATPase B/B' subunit [Sulfurospirillum deleyianum DSM 6946]